MAINHTGGTGEAVMDFKKRIYQPKLFCALAHHD